MKYRLGIDMGATSIGWCILSVSEDLPSGIIDMGVRIFPDGRRDDNNIPLAVNRREKRGMRRNLDRRKLRRNKLIRYLVSIDLMPENTTSRKDLEKLNPYALRAKALDKKISLHELGRSLFHISQRRGFKSNRKSDKKESDSSNMKIAIKELSEKMEDSKTRTLGEYLFKQGDFKEVNTKRKNPRQAPMHSSVRVKTTRLKGKNIYNLYSDRQMYSDEVTIILNKQKEYHKELTADVIKEIKDIIFYQRDLKSQEIGWCRFEDNEKRMRRAYPLFQHFRIYQEVNNLEVEKFRNNEESLTHEQRLKIIEKLKTEKHLTFKQIRKLLGLSGGAKFNLQAEKRDKLLGDQTTYAFSADKKNPCFGENWFNLSQDVQDEIITKVIDEENEQELVSWLMDKFALDEEHAENIANVSLDEVPGNLSRKAIEKILPHLEKGLIYDKACVEAGYHHSDFRTGEIFDQLPYYGEVLQKAVIGGSLAEEDKANPEKYFGKINNPTVHVAINQLRKIINHIIPKYGHPSEIVVEMARDLSLGEKGLSELNKFQTKNKNRNDKINIELEKLGVKANYKNRLQYKMWEDLAKDPAKRCCPFTGITISAEEIFSGKFEIEHLLPFSRSFNDSPANKTLSHRDANRIKGNRSPYEAFGNSPEGYNWEEISARATNLPDNKRWRFYPDAWDIAKGSGEDIIARMLVDTQYMSRLAKQYLSFTCHPNKVWTIPGRLTAMMRDKWGLNNLLGEEDSQKDRTDHRHHAIDAFVVACTNRAMLNKISGAAKRLREDESLYDKRLKLIEKMPEPFYCYYKNIQNAVDDIVISYKQDHGNAHRAIRSKTPFTVATLHKETAMGYVGKGIKKHTSIYVTRKPLEGFSKNKDIKSIADEKIKSRLLEKLSGLKEDSEDWKKALKEFSDQWNIRRLRVHVEKTNGTMVGIKKKGDSISEPYKYYAMGGNYCAEIFCHDKSKGGKKAGKWECEIIPNYYAHQKDFIQKWRKNYPTAKLIMRLQINDMVAYEEEGKTIIARVKKMSQPGRIYLRPHTISKEEGDKMSWGAFSNSLQQKHARKISVDVLGYIKDPLGGEYGRTNNRDNEGLLSSSD